MECGARVGKGVVTYPCTLEVNHPGPHMARENPPSVRQREVWEHQHEQERTVTRDHPDEDSFTVMGGAGEPMKMKSSRSDFMTGADREHPDNARRDREEEERMARLAESGAIEPADIELTDEDADMVEVEPTKQRPGDQPLPEKNEGVFIQEMVIEDIRERIKVGIQRYGTPLQALNRRDSILDAYQEAVDLVQYLKQVHVELGAIHDLVAAQADDEGLWFVAQTAPEAYLQQALRTLHEVIEQALGST